MQTLIATTSTDGCASFKSKSLGMLIKLDA